MHTHHIPSTASHLLAWQLMRLQNAPKEDDVPPPPTPKPETPQPETPPPPTTPQPEVPPEILPPSQKPEIPAQPNPLPGQTLKFSVR